VIDLFSLYIQKPVEWIRLSYTLITISIGLDAQIVCGEVKWMMMENKTSMIDGMGPVDDCIDRQTADSTTWLE
jgi:hypothetical protein